MTTTKNNMQRFQVNYEVYLTNRESLSNRDSGLSPTCELSRFEPVFCKYQSFYFGTAGSFVY
jgi:hypothetical protein